MGFLKWVLLVVMLTSMLFFLTSCSSLGGSMTLGTIHIPMILIYGVIIFALVIKIRDRHKK